MLRADPSRKGLLYAGTETGMYISFNEGQQWEKFQLNLPIVPITDLTIKDNNLIVATQGRSLWIIDDLSVLYQLSSDKKDKNTILYKPKDSYRTKGGGGFESKTAGTNHPNGVITHFYLKNYDKEKDTVAITFFDKKGDSIMSFGTHAKEHKLKDLKKGGNTFVWNMRYDGAERLKGMILWGANLNGPRAVPGEYKVSLSLNGTLVNQDFKILADPRAETDMNGFQKQFDFVSSVNSTIDKAHKSIKKMRKVSEQLDAFSAQYATDDNVKDLVAKAKEMKKKLTEVEEALYQTKNRSNQDPLNFPIRLTNKLGGVASLSNMDDFPPTDQAIVVSKQLTTKINEQLDLFNTVMSEEVAKFNAAFNKMQLNYLFVEE